MRRRTKRRLVRYAVGSVAVLAYVIVLVVFVRSNDGDVSDAAGLSNGPGSFSAPAEPTAVGSPSPSGTSSRTDIASLPPDIAPTTDPRLTLTPHIPGGFTVGAGPSHSVVLRVTSTAAINRIGFLVPTSLDNPIGDIRGVGTSWSVTTTAFGNPPYAAIFIQAGAAGAAITCTITVDSHVANTQTTHGAYGRQVCVG